MCNLPNISSQDLEELGQKRKSEMKKPSSEMVKLIMSELLLEDSV